MGMRAKKLLEKLLVAMNILVIGLFLAGLALLITKRKAWLLILALLVFLTTMDNSLDVIVHQIKNQKQFMGF